MNSDKLSLDDLISRARSFHYTYIPSRSDVFTHDGNGKIFLEVGQEYHVYTKNAEDYCVELPLCWEEPDGEYVLWRLRTDDQPRFTPDSNDLFFVDTPKISRDLGLILQAISDKLADLED